MTYPIDVAFHSADGGCITINTGSVDRQRDRVFPRGARLDNYMINPVVQWGHEYRQPWATIGRTVKLEVSDDGIEAEFELRGAANDADPQNIVRLLWDGGWVRTASIGFRSFQWDENELGGVDHMEWELLEWSLVPIPANQEAIRRVAKALNNETPSNAIVERAGRVLSAANEQALHEAIRLVQGVLDQQSDAGAPAGAPAGAERLDARVIEAINAYVSAIYRRKEPSHE